MEKIAAGLEMQQWQNMPPPVPVKKTEKDAKGKALDVLAMGAGLGYKIAGVSNQDLMAAAEHINSIAPDPLLQGNDYKIAAVSKAELIEPAQKVNEAPGQAVDPLAAVKR